MPQRKTRSRATKKPKPPPVHTKAKPRPARRTRNPDPKPADAKQVQKNYKAAQRRELADIRSNVIADAFGRDLSEVGETKEDIPVIVNPYGVIQYIAGVVYGAIANSDRPADYNMATNVIAKYARFVSSVGNLDNLNTLPRAVLELGYSLRARTVGKFRYTPVWTPLINAVLAMEGTGNLQLFTGFSMPTYQITTTTGYLTSDAARFSPSNEEINNWQSMHAGNLDLVNVIEGVRLDNGDASAFAWDTSGLHSLSSSQGSGQKLCAMFGSNGITQFFIHSDSSVGLETRIGKPHLAKLRLGTLSQSYGDGSNIPLYYVPPQSGSPRIARFLVPVKSFPSTLGYARVIGKKCGVDPQLKLVPFTSILQGVIARYEYLGGPTRMGATWLNNMSSYDLQVFAYQLVKHMYRKYSGVEVGVWAVTPSSSIGQTYTELEPYRIHFDDSVIEAIKVPEPIMRFISSQLAYMDAQGSIFPAATFQNFNVGTKLSNYMGTPVYTSIPLTAPYFDQRGLTKTDEIVALFKNLEALMAQYSNLVSPAVTSGSYLDTTLYIDPSDNLLGIWSRRPIGDRHFSQVMSNCGAISYETQTISNSIGNGVGSNMGAFGNHTFRQRFRRDLSGFQVLDSMSAAVVSDGFVTYGTLASNIQGNAGPDSNGYGVQAPIVAPAALKVSMPKVKSLDVPDKYQSVISKLAARLVPRKGNYCGPMWTAGVDTGDKPVEVVDGKYAVAPTDQEDKICKKHDEAYREAGDDQLAIGKADDDMLKSLERLRLSEGLSLYGHGARMAIGIKKRLNPTNPLAADDW